MRRKISQREARRLKKRVDELERMIHERGARYSGNYPGGVNFLTLAGDGLSQQSIGRLDTASMLGHHLVVKWNGEKLYFYAVEKWTLP